MTPNSVSAEKGCEKRRETDTSVDSDAKFARDRCIRVAAMDIMVIEGIWNICAVPGKALKGYSI